MKTIVLFVFFYLWVFNYVLGQTGQNCSSPYPITSLPFILTGQTTAGMGNEYNETMACNSLYMTGNDFVFQFTPSQNMNITIKLSNTNVMVGLFLLDGCPDNVSTNCIAKAESTNGNPVLSNIPVTANTTYYIIIDTHNIANLFPSTAFDISADEAHPVDIAPTRFWRPTSGCHLTSSTPVCILTRNYGIQAVDTTVLALYLDNVHLVTDTFVYHLPPDGTAWFWFSTTLNLAQEGKHLMKVINLTPGENNPLNDTLIKWIIHPKSVSSFPYEEDFEQNDGGWATNWISDIEPGTSWEWGIPQGTEINHAASGNFCWGTNLTGNYHSPENSYILSPCFDFSQLTSPIIDFDIFFKTATADIIQLEYSIDSAQTWNLLGNPGEGVNWYNTPSGYSEAGWNGNSGGWIHAQHSLTTLAGKSNVLLRFSLKGGINGTDEGVAIDNIRISESGFDISLQQLLYPYDSCGLGNNDTIKFIIKNEGLQDVNNLPLKISINNGQTFVLETVNQTITSQGSLTYTSQHHFDFSTYGTYRLTIIADLPTDENRYNDTLRSTIMNFPLITNFPYIEDFETNNGFWYATGMNNSWEWGIPADSQLTQAGSALQCWATNLTGYHNLAEESYVFSPCFVFDHLHKPLFKSLIWYEQTYPTYTQVEILNKQSGMWNVFGEASSNWYNSGYSWTYSSDGWKQAKNQIAPVTQGAIYQFRFHFKGTIQNGGFAFDKVEICDAPEAQFTTYMPTKSGFFVYFQNTSQRYDSCLWVFGDGQFSKEINPIHEYPSSDSVLVKLYVWNECDVDSFEKYVYPIFINIPENNVQSCLNIYANQNNLVIENHCNAKNTSAFISLYSATGKEISTIRTTLVENYTTIPLPPLSKGIYFIRIQTDESVSTLKFIINND